MNDIKLLNFLVTNLNDKNQTIKKLMIQLRNLTLLDEESKNTIEILTSLLALSVVGNVLMIFLILC
jgi:hypothetical protein